MGNKDSRIATNFFVGFAAIGLAPITGGQSLWALVPVATRAVVEAKTDLKRISVQNYIDSSDECMNARVLSVEVRYCHLNSKREDDIGGDLLDAGITLAARITFTTTDACHHWFLLVRVEGTDEYIYIDKHEYINIMKRTDTKGKNGAGDAWLSSKAEYYGEPRRHITLRELIDYAKQDKHQWYHLIDDNCQKYAGDVYNWLMD
jgi:hypothetical protein